MLKIIYGTQYYQNLKYFETSIFKYRALSIITRELSNSISELFNPIKENSNTTRLLKRTITLFKKSCQF